MIAAETTKTRRARRTRAFLYVLCGFVASVDAAGQAIKIANSPDAYEQMYGKPQHWPLRDLALGSRPLQNRAFWTQGVISMTGETIGLCVPDGVYCLTLDRPVPEIQEKFLATARSRIGEMATVTGAFVAPEAALHGSGLSGFMFWRFESGGAPPTGRSSVNRTALEDIVRDTDRFADRSVTIEGCFRGDRWPDAKDSPRPKAGQGWVVSDGPFHIWVMGQPARGNGWKLDTAEALGGYLVQADGKLQRAGDGVYLAAKSVRLLGRDEARCP